jgi:hypothetical protein
MSAIRIVAVEDERIVALHLRQQLQSLGYEVPAIAASGEAALNDITAFRPDIVLMDIHIEGEIDGIETAARIPAELGIPVIYLTAYSEEATLERARATKPYGYLIKPYSERELHATIQMALERREAEWALRASEERFRSIFGAVSDGIIIADADTEALTLVNSAGAAMFGYEPDELIGLRVEAISAGEAPYDAEAVRAKIAAAGASGQPQRFDLRCRSKDGALFWAEVSIRLARIGEQTKVLAVVRDLTERRAIEEQLRQALKMEAIGQLTGGLAHDFNNLLGVIIGNLDLLRETRTDNDEIGELSEEALTAALSGAELTRRLLAFSRRQPLQPQSLDPNALIEDAAKLLRRLIGETVEITLDLDPAVGPIIADAAQLEAALTNLATNARDAMAGGGKLMIATGRTQLRAEDAGLGPDMAPGDYAVIEVSDTGEGIAPDALGKIFEPFYTTKDRDRGTGLGLSMVFGFLKQSGGHVSVYSEVGVGTTFRLYLPSAAEPAAARESGQAEGASLGRGETVLVVEDNAPLRRVAVRELRALGYRVIEVADGPAALAALGAQRVDLLFTDVVMPRGLGGFELAEQARQRQPGLKVLLASGFPEAGLAERFRASAFPLLTKPYRRADLARAVREQLDAAA